MPLDADGVAMFQCLAELYHGYPDSCVVVAYFSHFLFFSFFIFLWLGFFHGVGMFFIYLRFCKGLNSESEMDAGDKGAQRSPYEPSATKM